jgi:hypothetical protein
MDLRAGTYQDFDTLISGLSRRLNQLEDYQGTNWGGDEIDPSEITDRTLHLIVPKGTMTPNQRAAIAAAHIEARKRGLNLLVTEF